MKKRVLRSFLLLTLTLAFALLLCACGEEPVTTYKITFINGTATHEVKTVAEGELIPLPEAPTMDSETIEYTFLGWYDGEEKLEGGVTRASEDKMYIAKYSESAKPVTIKFISNGEVYEERTVERGGYVSEPADNPTVEPTATTAFSFDGWFDEAGNQFQYGEFVSKSNTYTAKFTEYPRRFRVTFQISDNIVAGIDLVDYGKTYEIPARIPTKKATDDVVYTFAGWFDADGNAPDESVPVTEDLTFYAKFDSRPPFTYTYTFINGDETFATLSIKETEKVKVPTPAPSGIETPVALRFSGWYDAEGKHIKTDENPTEDKTYYAVFGCAGVEHTFGCAPVTFGGESVIPCNYCDAGLTESGPEIFLVGVTKTVEREKCTVRFIIGETVVESMEVKPGAWVMFEIYPKSMDLPEGKEFAGWYNEDGETVGWLRRVLNDETWYAALSCAGNHSFVCDPVTINGLTAIPCLYCDMAKAGAIELVAFGITKTHSGE